MTPPAASLGASGFDVEPMKYPTAADTPAAMIASVKILLERVFLECSLDSFKILHNIAITDLFKIYCKIKLFRLTEELLGLFL